MERFQICARNATRLLLGALIIAGCGRMAGPTGPTAGGAFDAAEARHGATGHMVELCHATGDGGFMPLSVALAAEPAHRRHGDGAVGEAVPNRPNMEFDEDCAPAQAAPELTLLCGAPPNPTNPGSTTWPGPDLDTTRGVQTIQYSVTAVPAPPDFTLIDWAFYLDGVLIPPTAQRFLVGGTYTEFGHGVGMATTSGVLEVRFTLDGAECSIYWNLNP